MIPDPGRYEGIDDDVYHQGEGWVDLLNNSRLGYMTRSDLYCKHMIDTSEIDRGTKDTDYGKGIHCCVLEPNEFDGRFMLEPLNDAGRNPRGWHSTNDYKALKLDLTSRGFTVLPQKHLDGCRRIRDRVFSAEGKIREILQATAATEVSYVADDPETGLRCKVRPDMELPDAEMFCDVKKTRDASLPAFTRAIGTFGYHRQKPFYLDIASAEGTQQWKHFLFLAIEDTEPHEIALYDLDPAATEYGRRELRRLKARYLECINSSNWPGYSSEVQTIGIPNWKYYQEEEEYE